MNAFCRKWGAWSVLIFGSRKERKAQRGFVVRGAKTVANWFHLLAPFASSIKVRVKSSLFGKRQLFTHQ